MGNVRTDEKLDHLLDAERAVIGAMLVDPDVVRPLLSRVRDADFYNLANRLIFQTARALFRAGVTPDAVTIRDRIGPDYSRYMAELVEITPTAANWEAYAEAMRSQATVRRIHEFADALSAAQTVEDCRPVCAKLSRELSEGTSVEAWTMAQMTEDFCQTQDPYAPAPVYIDYGLDFLKGRTYTKPGDVVIIGGYPSDGKTALALQMAYRMAQDHRVGFFSLETDKDKIRDRLMAAVVQIDFDRIKTRSLTEDDWRAFAEKSADMAGRGLTVVEASGMTATTIQSVSQAYGFDVIFLDYIQLVTPEIDQRAPRSEQMAAVSRQLHTFAQKSGTLVVELAQLSRPDKAAGWRAPAMSDLKESGQFEQDADMIFMVYRPDPKAKDGPELDQNKHRVLKIAKNKEGPRGAWYMVFDGPKQTFSLLVNPDGRSVMRQFSAAGKAAKQRPRQVSFWGDGSDWTEAPADTETPWGDENKGEKA